MVDVGLFLSHRVDPVHYVPWDFVATDDPFARFCIDGNDANTLAASLTVLGVRVDYHLWAGWSTYEASQGRQAVEQEAKEVGHGLESG